jgi:molecular chaperone Hsp33
VTESKWTKYLSDQSNIRAVAVEASSLVQELTDRHKLSDIGGQGLGEASIGLLLIASAQKDGNRLNLSIRGDGLIRRAVVDAYPEGNVRGYITENTQNAETENLGPWGRGMLSVLYTKYEETEQPYIGTVPLLTGHLAQDLTHFWLQSAQLPSVVGLDVKVKAGKVVKASGLLIQTLGNATDEDRKIILSLGNDIQKLTEALGPSKQAHDVLSEAIPGKTFSVIEDSRLSFQCKCSEERVERALLLTGEKEIQSMIDANEPVKAHCEFCNTEYHITVERLKILKKVGLE